MRDRMERLVVLPFSIGCASQSSVAVISNHPKKTKHASNVTPRDEGKSGQCFAGTRMKNSLGNLPHPKSSISSGLQRLAKSLKSLTQLFVYKEEFVEMDMEMEIGLPTDVKHVAHIGWDGSTTTMKSWDDLKSPELLSLPSISLHQFEFAMAAQAGAPSATATPKFG